MRHQEWQEIAEDYAGAALVLGNGFSISVDGRFDADFLTGKAISIHSDEADRTVVAHILQAVGEDGIESALEALGKSQKVVEVVGADASLIQRLEEAEAAVRDSLIRTIREVHPQYGEVIEKLRRRSGNLSHFGSVFTTNYDVLLYWMVMSSGLTRKSRKHPQFVDFFWDDGNFNPLSVTTSHRQVPVFYLHGALHIVKDSLGVTSKRSSADGTLVTTLEDVPQGVELVIVTEGTPRQKVEAIRRSEYLFEALQRLERQRRVVVLGHSLSSVDEHLVRAIADNADAVAVGIHGDGDAAAIERQLRKWARVLRIDFFDAASQPLCSDQ